MPDEMEKFNEALSYLKAAYPVSPEIGIVLGSGLGNFSDEVKLSYFHCAGT